MYARRYQLNGTSNTRDLGGYPLESGGATRYGRFLRSDVPSALTPEDIRLLWELGVRDSIDLRTPEERRGRPSSLEQSPIRCWHCPFVEGSAVPEREEDIPQSYLDVLESPQMEQVLRIILQAQGGVLFHCSAGKDRTGVVSMFLLLHAGVPRQDILADYQLSDGYLAPRIQAMRQKEPGLPLFLGRAKRWYMEEAMALFEKRYGTTGRYLEQHGFSAQQQQALGEHLTKEEATWHRYGIF